MTADYPSWICHTCGMKYGRNPMSERISTFHQGECELCGVIDSVTEPRDYGHLRDGWIWAVNQDRKEVQ